MPNINGVVAQNLARHRLQRHMSTSHVARLAGISKATLLSIELGQANPTLDTLQRICNGLNIPIEELVCERPTPGIDVRRAEDAVLRPFHGMLLRPLATYYRTELVYVFTATVNGDGNVADAHEPGSSESILVLSGAVVAGPMEASVELKTGDWIRYPSDSEHGCRAIDGTAEILMVATRQVIPGLEEHPEFEAIQLGHSDVITKNA